MKSVNKREKKFTNTYSKNKSPLKIFFMSGNI